MRVLKVSNSKEHVIIKKGYSYLKILGKLDIFLIKLSGNSTTKGNGRLKSKCL